MTSTIKVTPDYRFTFNGMLRDDDVRDEKLTSYNEGRGNSCSTEYRFYDNRAGRWLSLDPLASKFPWSSPYVAMGNNPVIFTDVKGDSIDIGNLLDVDDKGNLKNRQDVQAFEAFASTNFGKNWILERAQKGFTYVGSIYKDLNIYAENEGQLSNKGIDYIFSYNYDIDNRTKASILQNRLKIEINIMNYINFTEYNKTILEKTNTLIHEALYHGNNFEIQFLSNNYRLKNNYIVPTTHQHYDLDLSKEFDRKWYSILQNSLKKSYFGKNGFKILNNINIQYNVNQTKNDILKIMRQGFHEYKWSEGFENFKKNIKK